MFTVSSNFLAAVSGVHQMAVQAQVLSGFGLSTLTQFEITDGSVSIDAQALIRRGLTLTLVDPTGTLTPQSASSLFTPYGNEIMLSRGVQYADGSQELVPLGVFVLTDVRVQEQNGVVSIMLTGSDRAFIVQSNPWTDAFVIAAGTTMDTALINLISDRYPNAGFVLPPSMASLTLPLIVYGVSGDLTDPWTDAVTLAASAGYDLYFDNNGNVAATQLAGLTMSDPVAVYGSDQGVRVLTSIDRSLSSTGVYSGVIVTAENSGLSVPLRAESWDANPASPTYYLGNFGKRPYMYSSSTITTQQQAQDAADSLLNMMLGASEELTWEMVCNPAHTVYDLVKISHPTLAVNDVLLIQSLTIPLTQANPMQCSGFVRVF